MRTTQVQLRYVTSVVDGLTTAGAIEAVAPGAKVPMSSSLSVSVPTGSRTAVLLGRQLETAVSRALRIEACLLTRRLSGTTIAPGKRSSWAIDVSRGFSRSSL